MSRANMMVVLALAASFTCAPAGAQLYKWVDEKGVTQYTDQPPPTGKSSTLKPAGRAKPTSADDPKAVNDLCKSWALTAARRVGSTPAPKVCGDRSYTCEMYSFRPGTDHCMITSPNGSSIKIIQR
jgi:hypothetical protein